MTMPQFDHEKLMVYKESIHFVAWVEELLDSVPKSIGKSTKLRQMRGKRR